MARAGLTTLCGVNATPARASRLARATASLWARRASRRARLGRCGLAGCQPRERQWRRRSRPRGGHRGAPRRSRWYKPRQLMYCGLRRMSSAVRRPASRGPSAPAAVDDGALMAPVPPRARPRPRRAACGRLRAASRRRRRWGDAGRDRSAAAASSRGKGAAQAALRFAARGAAGDRSATAAWRAGECKGSAAACALARNRCGRPLLGCWPR